jgi:hypothetical protein
VSGFTASAVNTVGGEARDGSRRRPQGAAMREAMRTWWAAGGQAIAGVSASAAAMVALVGFTLAQHAQYAARVVGG